MLAEATEKTFKLIIEYDGTDFHGWQRQKNDRTVQETIEKALTVMTREKVTVIGSGRTDAGVHALGQVASFKTRSRLNATAFFNGLNSLLPDDVVIRSCDQMPDTFHARFDVKSKRYRYHILNRTIAPAIGRQFVWHIRKPLDISAMSEAAGTLLGTHDFKAFEGTGSPRDHTIRTVTAATIKETGGGNLTYDIEANGFLRFMVRNIVGTLVEVGLGKISSKNVQEILQSKDRSRAGATAPPQGLFLVDVTYSPSQNVLIRVD
ncbi:MAG: tRNA pseudouridine(38-40) synthase TruA [Desulfosarcina sp.]|nr:tRNA pseudouridine(38-40) synthase TruA [Desulfosarcina sp.]MBC2743368.1 tRNA pseudouridine(38-40) synthase TruA [Desulfosarcina sp.]MBC2766278.1 tRNA pseudouridine(38-40) synthase TruA [Desulfosarcina sp.]